MARGKLINLTQAWRIHRLSEDGKNIRAIADEMSISKSAVHRILTGEGLNEVRQIAANMEVFLGGAIIGEGNLRAHAEDGSYIGEATTSRHQHPIGETWADGRRALPTPDVLSVLLAEENLVERMAAAGINPDEVLVLDYDTDTDEPSGKLDQSRAGQETKRAETWDELLEQVHDKHPGKSDAYLIAVALKQCEREGAEVDSNDVRDPNFKGWPTTPWTPAKTNREDI